MALDGSATMRLVHLRGDRKLYRGMKDCLGFALVREGWVDVAHGSAAPQRQHAGDVVVVEPGEVYCEHRRSADSALDMMLLFRQTAQLPRAERGLLRLSTEDPRATNVVRLIDAVRTKAETLEVETAVCEVTRSLATPQLAEERSVSRASTAVKKARELLLDRFRENVRLDELAEHAGLDKYQLVRAFRARHGVPPYEYLTHARILLARKLLLGNQRPSDVAAAVGYCDQSQLHRHFVRIVGTTPGRYRELW